MCDVCTYVSGTHTRFASGYATAFTTLAVRRPGVASPVVPGTTVAGAQVVPDAGDDEDEYDEPRAEQERLIHDGVDESPPGSPPFDDVG